MLYDIPRLDGSVRYSVFFSLLPFLGWNSQNIPMFELDTVSKRIAFQC